MFVSDTLGSLRLASLDFRSLRASSSMVLNKNPIRLAIQYSRFQILYFNYFLDIFDINDFEIFH